MSARGRGLFGQIGRKAAICGVHTCQTKSFIFHQLSVNWLPTIRSFFFSDLTFYVSLSIWEMFPLVWKSIDNGNNPCDYTHPNNGLAECVCWSSQCITGVTVVNCAFVLLVCEKRFLIPHCCTCQACVSNHPCQLFFFCEMFVSSLHCMIVLRCLVYVILVSNSWWCG